jgi:hypothetical protein
VPNRTENANQSKIWKKLQNEKLSPTGLLFRKTAATDARRHTTVATPNATTNGLAHHARKSAYHAENQMNQRLIHATTAKTERQNATGENPAPDAESRGEIASMKPNTC